MRENYSEKLIANNGGVQRRVQEKSRPINPSVGTDHIAVVIAACNQTFPFFNSVAVANNRFVPMSPLV